jgi:hypothetical protein
MTRGNVVNRFTRLFHPDADHQGRSPHVVDAGMEGDVPVHIGGMADKDVVDGSRYHASVEMITVHIFERSLFGHLVQFLQQEAEAKVSLKRLIQNHEAAAQL